MSSNLKVNAILPSTGTNVAIGTAGGSITMVGNVDIDINSGISTFNDIHISDKIVHDGDTNTSLRFPAADTITAETAGTERVRITSNGSVVVGGDTPATVGQTQLTLRSNSQVGLSLLCGAIQNATITFGGLADGYSSGDSGYDDGKIMYDNSNNHMQFNTAGGERLRITSNGRVGINESTPLGKLHVRSSDSGATVGASADELVLESSANTGMTILSGTTGEGAINFGDSGDNNIGKITYMHDGNYMYFKTNDTERLRITAGGQVRVGNTDITTASAADDLIIGPNTPAGDHGITIISGTSGTGNIYFGDTNTSATGNRMGTITYSHNDNYFRFSTNGNDEKLRITSDGKVGINENAPENELHIAGTTGTAAGGLLRLDATTGDNFIIFDNTADSSEWVGGIDSSTRNEFRLYYNGGSGYGDPIINVDGTANNGKVTIDGGTSTLVSVKANNGGAAGLRCGGDSTQNQSTGYVEVHQDESHGGGFFYNGDGSPSFASSNETADYFSIYRLSGGQRHVLQRWFHSGNDCEMFGNLLIDNGNTTTLTVRGNSSGTAGVRAGGSAGSGSSQCTGYLEAHQDEGHGGGISYNGDGTPSFVNNETADHVTFYRLSGGTRERVFSYPYNSNAVSFRGGISASSKSFRITHPHPSKKDTHDLVHSSIEGPQADNIYRGKVDLVGGTATVNIDTTSNMTDGTFVLLNRDIQCFTSNETGWTAVKGSVSGNLLTITAQDNSCTDTISWMVVGERQDDNIKSSDVDTTDADGKIIVELLKGS